MNDTIGAWVVENKEELRKSYKEYLESMIEAGELETIEDWNRWTETEWTNQNIPF